MTELSPAAIAVDDALAACIQLQGEMIRARPLAAAALRAAVGQVLPANASPVGDEHDAARADQWLRIRIKMLAIASELEAQ